jgi:D-alanyl-D-alanine carboxypeptidase/D-alanyl-D-alanine-endopeptidase (penicillin-binding protein 4)
VPPPLATPSAALTALRHKLSADIGAGPGSKSGLVVDLTTNRTLWAYSDNTPRLPASIEKLWTTTTALLELGPDATFQTQVYANGRLTSAGALIGTLYLRGGGDPTFGSAGFDHVMYGTGATVQRLAADIRALGITRIQGRILGDDSYFDSLRGTPATGYRANLEVEGELSGLSYDAGFTSLAEDQLQADPPLFAAQAFAAALRADGVRLAPGTRIGAGRTPPTATLLASESSPNLATLMALTNAPSDNFFAETLLKDIGARLGGGGSTARGAAVVRRFIGRTFGLHPRLDDGSGLSRYDRTSARQIVLLLREMRSQPAFFNSLAVAGVSGTWRYQMLGTPAVNNCRGKDGTLHDVANLVGYCRAANGNQLVFAFLMNGLSNPAAAHQQEDEAGAALAEYRG